MELAQCFVRAGRVYLKAGVTAEWQTAWILVQSDKKLWIHVSISYSLFASSLPSETGV